MVVYLVGAGLPTRHLESMLGSVSLEFYDVLLSWSTAPDDGGHGALLFFVMVGAIFFLAEEGVDACVLPFFWVD